MFTQPAFIRSNTPELRKKLEELGYYAHPAEKKLYEDLPNYVGPSLHTGRGFYSLMPIGYTEEVELEIYCKTNEELFLAIAALRDDADINQWFCTDEKDIENRLWFLCLQDKVEEHFEGMSFHKATVEELIEYFKTE